MEQRIEGLKPVETLAVLHSRRERDARLAADRLAEGMGVERPILVRETGAVLSSHAGPGVVGVIAVREKPAESGLGQVLLSD